MAKAYFMVITFENRYTFDSEKTAIDFACDLSMSEELLDTDIKVVKIEETKIETFRNGGVVA